MHYFSQLGQDRWVNEEIYPGRKGYFVEIGSHDGVKLSNTFALEGLGWTGICVEPSQFFHKMKARRKCICDQRVITTFDGQVCFAENGVLGKISSGGEPRECCTIGKLLLDHKAPLFIEYLSIDTEGGELEILDQALYDFAWEFGAITIETNGKEAQIETMLRDFYYETKRVEQDIWAWKS